MSGPTLTDALLARGYTHRPRTEEERRAHPHIYARAIVDGDGRCVAVLSAREAWAWLKETA